MAENKKLDGQIRKKIRQLEIFTRRILSGSQIGDARSAVKGTGLEFDQIREYCPGDDVRFIDWNASARSNKLLVKQYIEERSRTIFLAVDTSSSMFFGSGTQLKQDRAAEIAGILSLVAQYGKDRVSLIQFTDHVERYIPPSKGQQHIRRILHALFDAPSQSRKTDLRCALKKLQQLKKKDAVVFVISDFIDTHVNSKLWALLGRSADVVAIRTLDQRECGFPPVGFITIQDSELGNQVVVDARKSKIAALKDFVLDYGHEQKKIINKYGVELLDVQHGDSSIAELIRFFRRRMRY